MRAYSLSHIRLIATPWVVARQAPLSMGFSRQGYWNRFPFPSPGDLPNPEIKPGSPVLQADSLLTELQGSVCFTLMERRKERGRYSILRTLILLLVIIAVNIY